MDRHPINPDAKSLEDAFFARENAKLLERLRAQATRQERHAALRQALPNADEPTLDHLIELGVRPETALAVLLVPLTAVAWADGSIDPRERDAILRAAEQHGVARESPAHALVESWLAVRPGAEIVEAWKRYVRAIWPTLTENERQAFRERAVGTARAVAEAAGGFLGLTSRVSAAERATLEELGEVLG
ncbi:MAG TPA: hypothetical protein VJS92_17150 [Candidatus Polarisedimenticolaceae bacterium]|nr:hypothetical protein [Candidatus Polarisedimenticolaceae bacterium]